MAVATEHRTEESGRGKSGYGFVDVELDERGTKNGDFIAENSGNGFVGHRHLQDTLANALAERIWTWHSYESYEE